MGNKIENELNSIKKYAWPERCEVNWQLPLRDTIMDNFYFLHFAFLCFSHILQIWIFRIMENNVKVFLIFQAHLNSIWVGLAMQLFCVIHPFFPPDWVGPLAAGAWRGVVHPKCGPDTIIKDSSCLLETPSLSSRPWIWPLFSRAGAQRWRPGGCG